MSDVMGSTLAFPDSLANFGKRENAERGTSARISMSNDILVSPAGTVIPCCGVSSPLCARRLDLCGSELSVRERSL